MRAVRWLAWSVGVLFLIGTALQLVDILNLYATPPDTGAANMVEQRLAVQGYRVAIWPIYFLNNLSFAIAFVALAGLGVALAALLAPPDARRIAIIVSLGVGGILGAAGQLILIGATQVTIDISYCDCGFKETEIIAGQWAGMVAHDISAWLDRFAAIVLAVGLISLARDAGAVISDTLRTWTYITAIALIAWPILGIVQLIDPMFEELIALVAGAVLVPIWAVWLGRSVDRPAESMQAVSA